MRAKQWLARIDASADENAVLAAVRRFTSKLSGYDLAQIPPHCRPPEAFTAELVERLHGSILECLDDELDRNQLRLLKRLEEVLAHACARLDELGVRSPRLAPSRPAPGSGLPSPR